MNRIDIDDIVNVVSYLFDERDYSKLYMLDNKRLFKIFDSDFLREMSCAGYDIERKILNHEGLVNDGVIVPIDAVYYKKRFVGYTMPYFNGVSVFDAYDSGYFNNSLYKYAEFFSKLENIVIKNDKIVFTDLLSDGNIMVNANDDIKIIDFDDLQIDFYGTLTLSSGLGSKYIYTNTKYMDDSLYTKELDVKSLIYLYFNLVFQVDLSSEIDNNISLIRKDLILKQIFNDLNIDDRNLIDKVLRLYDNNLNNLYLGDTLYHIAEKYSLCEYGYDSNFVKKLIKK